MLREDPTFTAAKQIVADLEVGNFESVMATLNQFAGDQRALVIKKSIALGADPDVLSSLTLQPEETIEIVSTLPPSVRSVGIKVWPRLPLILAGVAGILAGAWLHARR